MHGIASTLPKLGVFTAGQCEMDHGNGRYFDAFYPGRLTTGQASSFEFDDRLRAGRSMSSQPSEVTVARSPGRNSTVVIADSTIAGPAIVCPEARASKSQTGAGTHSSSQIRRSERGGAGGASGKAGSCGSAERMPATATRALTRTVSWSGEE